MPKLMSSIAERDWAGARNGLSAPPSITMQEKAVQPAGLWDPAVQKILGFQGLGDGWDGLGAKAPTKELLQSAIGLAYLLSEKGVAPPHCVVPGLDGSINFEWQDPDGTIAEVEIDRPLHAEVMLMEPGKSARFWTLPTE